jgi:replication factor A1
MKEINEFYQTIKDLQTKEEFQKTIKQRQKEYNFLFDKKTTALMIIDELGRNKKSIKKINDINPGDECTIEAEVKNIGAIREFKRKNGRIGRVINLTLEDQTGSCNLAIWDRKIQTLKEKQIKNNDTIRVINGYVKNGYHGIEINLGRWGLIEKTENGKEKTEEKNTKIKGIITDIKSTRSFIRNNGDFGFISEITLKNKKQKYQISVWDQKVKEIQQYNIGDVLEIEKYDTRAKNGNTEIHLNGKSIIKKT